MQGNITNTDFMILRDLGETLAPLKRPPGVLLPSEQARELFFHCREAEAKLKKNGWTHVLAWSAIKDVWEGLPPAPVNEPQ